MLEMEESKRRSDSRELSDLLGLAESIQASYESSRRRESLWELVEAVLVLAGVTAFISAVVSDDQEGLWIGVAAGVAAAIYAIAADAVVVQRIRRRSKRDRRALREVLDLLSELEGVASIEESWPPLQRAEFRIRLSRFEFEDPPTLPKFLRRFLIIFR
jgi:Flp pilus assembly protein TadB